MIRIPAGAGVPALDGGVVSTLLRPRPPPHTRRLPTLTDPDAAVLRDLLLERGIRLDDPGWGQTADLHALACLIWTDPLVRPIAVAVLGHRMPRVLWRSQRLDDEPLLDVVRARWERIAFDLAVRAVLLGGPEVTLVDARRAPRSLRAAQFIDLARPTLVYVRAKRRGESMRGWVGPHAGIRYLATGRAPG